jgi:hypothetical protein
MGGRAVGGYNDIVRVLRHRLLRVPGPGAALSGHSRALRNKAAGPQLLPKLEGDLCLQRVVVLKNLLVTSRANDKRDGLGCRR